MSEYKLTPTEEVHLDTIRVEAYGSRHTPHYCEMKAEGYEGIADWCRALAWWCRAADVTTGNARRRRYESSAEECRKNIAKQNIKNIAKVGAP